MIDTDIICYTRDAFGGSAIEIAALFDLFQLSASRELKYVVFKEKITQEKRIADQ